MALLPLPKIKDKMQGTFSGPWALSVLPQKLLCGSPALWKGASGPIWDFIIHPTRLQLGWSWALSPTDKISGTAPIMVAQPGSRLC